MTLTNQSIVTFLVFVRDLLHFLALTAYFYAEALFRVFVKPPLKSIAGEVILITGGGNGIGKEVVLQLAELQAKIVIWDVDENACNKLVEELKALGCDAYGFKVDVSDRTQVDSVAKQVEANVGSVTILINNAAVMPCKSFFNYSPQELEKMYNINVFGNYWTLRAFLPKMISSNRGQVVTMCSAAGIVSTRNLIPYCGTKHAVHALVEGLKYELECMENPPKILFTTIYPFSCNTGLLTGVKSHSRFPWLIPNALDPKDVASKVVEGLRRNYEHVYVPGFVDFVGNGSRALLPKVQYAARDFFQCYVEPAPGF